MMIRSQEELFDRVWHYLLKVLRDEVSRTSKSQAAKKIGVSPSTVGRWLAGERGVEVTLISAIGIVFKLGGTMPDLARELGDELTAAVLELVVSEPDLMQNIVEVLKSDTEEAERLRSEIRYFVKKIK